MLKNDNKNHVIIVWVITREQSLPGMAHKIDPPLLLSIQQQDQMDCQSHQDQELTHTTA